MEKTLNCMGMACPLPVVNAKKAIESFAEDGILHVKVDNDTAVQNLTKLGQALHGELGDVEEAAVEEHRGLLGREDAAALHGEAGLHEPGNRRLREDHEGVLRLGHRSSFRRRNTWQECTCSNLLWYHVT